jgi:hypothetical protein
VAARPADYSQGSEVTERGFIDMRIHRHLAVKSSLFDGEVEVDVRTLGDDVIGVLLVRRSRTEHATVAIECVDAPVRRAS